MNLEDLDDENDLFNSILRIEDNISRRKTADSHLRLSNLKSSDFQKEKSDPYSDLHHEYEEETMKVDRRERNNVFQAFLEKREKKNKQPPRSPPSSRFKNDNSQNPYSQNPYSSNLDSDERLFSNAKKVSKVEDSFIAESENFLEEISNLQKMTLDLKTVDKRKQKVSKLNDFKRKLPQKVEESAAKPIQQSSNISLARTSINLRPNLEHHFESLDRTPDQSLSDEHEHSEMSFKKQLEERIRLRNENHRLGLKREDPNRPSQTKNVMKPDDLRKLITSVKKKSNSKQSSSRAFCLAGLLDDVEKNQNMYNTEVQKLQTSADFTASNKKFSKSMLQTNKSLDKAIISTTLNRSSSAKKVRFNPSETESRSKSLSKKDPIIAGQFKKNMGLVNDSVFVSKGGKKPAETNQRNNHVQSTSTSSFRDLLAQRKGLTLPKEKPNPEKIPSQRSNLNNSKTISFSTQSNDFKISPSKMPDYPGTKKKFSTKSPIFSKASAKPQFDDDSEEDEDFLEARRLMQRISMLRNYIGGE